jgi:endoglucanase
MFKTRKAASTAALCTLLLAPGAMSAPPGTLPFGAYDPDGYFGSDDDLTIEHVFMPWEDVNLNTLVDADQYALSRKRSLLITIEPWTWTRSERNTPGFLWRGIRDGYYDANMRSICSVIGTLQSPVSVRWGHEMEIETGQFIWSAWKPEDYITAFRRMMDICRAEAPKIAVVWSPLGLANAGDYYPGDDYVDIVGLSIFGYQPYEEAVEGGARSYDQKLDEHYNNVKRFDKPILVAEAGYTGQKTYVDLWESQVRKARPDLPLLIGAVYFNQPEVYPWPDGFGLPDWRVTQRILPPPS